MNQTEPNEAPAGKELVPTFAPNPSALGRLSHAAGAMTVNGCKRIRATRRHSRRAVKTTNHPPLKPSTMKKTFRQVALGTALACATLTAASCSDGRQSEKANGDGSDKSELTDKDGELAKMAEGNWIYKDELTDEDGDPFTQVSLITFKHDPDSTTDGGTFVERTYFQQNWEDEDLKYNYASTTEVEGTWEIVMGSLCQTYNISSLTVSLDHFDYKPANTDVAWQMLDYTLENLGEDMIDKDKLGEEIRKADYKEKRALYVSQNKDDAEGAGFTDLKIDGETLSYATGDMGRLTYHCISDADIENGSWKN